MRLVRDSRVEPGQEHQLYMDCFWKSYHQIMWTSAMNFIGYVQWTTTIPCYMEFSFFIWDEIQSSMTEFRMLKHLMRF